MNCVVILDTRNQKDGFVEESLKALGCQILRSKLPFGDVALPTNILNCIDLKSSGGGLIELSKNICSKDHNRLKREIELCLAMNGKITFLCLEKGINKVEDIKDWIVPTFKGTLIKNNKCIHRKGEPMTKVKPETLMKAIQTMTKQDHYRVGFKVNFEFTDKQSCGHKILNILGVRYE